MDSEELKLLIKDVVKEVVQEILKEQKTEPTEKPKTTRKRSTKTDPKRVSKPRVKKQTASKEEDFNSKKLKEEPWRRTFVDTLEEEVYIDTQNGKVNLIELDKKIVKSKPRKNKQPRSVEKPIIKKCACGKDFEAYGSAYLCNKCITGR
jgi:hypothetical protein